MRAVLSRLIADARAGITLITAGSLSLCIGFSAFAVDLASIHLASRRLQGTADAAALAAASRMDQADAVAAATVGANGWDDARATVTPGRYRRDATIPVADRFLAGGVAPDAVRVDLSASAPVFFALAFINGDSVPIRRSATATHARYAAFSIGSRLASFDGGLAGDYLSELAGTDLRLEVMDYEALLAADVDLLAFSQALATRIDAEALSFDEVLGSTIDTPAAMGALGDTLAGSGQAAAAAAANRIAQRLSGTSITLSDLLDLGPYGAQDRGVGASPARVGGYDLAQALLELAAGARQVRLDLGAGLPGLAGATVHVAVGERPHNSPWIAITDRGELVVRTAQTRIYIEARAPGSGLLSALGLGALRVPIFVELAAAEAKLDDIVCAGGDRGVTLLVKPSVGSIAIADLDIGRLDDHRTAVPLRPARLVSNLLVQVTAQSSALLGGSTWQSVAFTQADIDAGAMKTVATGDIVTTLARSMVRDMSLTVRPLGLIPIPAGPILAAVGGQLAILAGPVDALLGGVLGLLGVGLGEADVRVNGMRCGQPALVA